MICSMCGGTFVMQSARGLNWELVHGVPLPIPASIEVLRCSNPNCDNHAMDAAKVREIERAVTRAQQQERTTQEIIGVIRLATERGTINLTRGTGFDKVLEALEAFEDAVRQNTISQKEIDQTQASAS